MMIMYPDNDDSYLDTGYEELGHVGHPIWAKNLRQAVGARNTGVGPQGTRGHHGTVQ